MPHKADKYHSNIYDVIMSFTLTRKKELEFSPRGRSLKFASYEDATTVKGELFKCCLSHNYSKTKYTDAL